MGSAINCGLLPPLHGHAAPGLRLLFFMVVRLMPQGDPHLLEFLHSLAVNVQPGLCRHSRCVIPEDIAHVVEQAGHCQQQFWTLPLLLAFQNIPSTGMAIRIRHPEAVPGRFFVFGNAVACEVQLPQQIVRPGMILVSCVTEILRRFDCVLLHGLARQVFLSQSIGSVGVPVSNCSLQPPDALTNIMDLRIVRVI